MTHIYLDYNASAPLHPDAWAVMEPVLKVQGGAHNASAVHHYGRAGRKIVEDARRHVAQLVGADVNQVIFNSGATEGNNTVLRHFSETYADEVILVSSIEHPSVLEGLEAHGRIQCVPVDGDGRIRLDALEEMLSGEGKVSLLSCMAVNNETGVIQDIASLSALAHRHGALFHCDATQAAGRIPVDMKALGIDFLTLSSHKIGGPQGVGALVLGLCGQTPKLLFGGGQEKSTRAGTENVAGIAGFGAAAGAVLAGLEDYQGLAALRDRLEVELKAISPEIIIHSKDALRVVNTSFFSLAGANAQSMLMALDLEGIAVSNGSACSSGSVKPSITLKAMGQSAEIASSALRVSIGWDTKEGDIDAFLSAWTKIYSRIKVG
ncbi:MAG: cysteine desulfurase [Alphaproteobacteria bacterium]|nr:MAG: cysteine desulfurase [Alphaproteobacteria bacterium]